MSKTEIRSKLSTKTWFLKYNSILESIFFHVMYGYMENKSIQNKKKTIDAMSNDFINHLKSSCKKSSNREQSKHKVAS